MKNKIDLLLLNVGHALIATANNANVAAAQALEVIDGGKTTPEEKTPTKTDKKLPNPERKVYTKAEPPKTKAERDLFKIHWASLGKEGLQDEYNDGKVDSEGGVLEGGEDFDSSDFDAPAKEDAKTYTAEEVRKSLQKYAKEKGKDAAYKVLSSVGAKKIADIEEDKFAAVMAEIA